MEKDMKQKYVRCELNVVEFKVERGFASSVQNAFTNATNIWSMTNDGSGNYRNEGYLQQTFDWGDGQRNLPSM